MKRIISSFFVIIIVGFVAVSNAQETNITDSIFYYYKGMKLHLPLNMENVVVYYNAQEPLDLNSVFDSMKIVEEVILYGERSFPNQKRLLINIGQKNYDNSVKVLQNIVDVVDVEPVIGIDKLKKVSRRFYVKLKNENDYSKLDSVSLLNRVIILGEVRSCENWYELEVSKNSTGNSITVSNLYWETGLFADIDPGFLFDFQNNFAYCVTDSSFNEQWGPQLIHACEAWNLTTGTPRVRVAVIDEGVDVQHRELNHVNVYYSYDEITESVPAQLYYTISNSGQYVYHGTHVGGIIFSNHNANKIAGISPNASLINISHNLSAGNDDQVAKLATAISHAVQQGAHIINNSWGDQGGVIQNLHSPLIEQYIDMAINNNCLVVFAAGNHSPSMDYPATYRDEILTVGSIDQDYTKSDFSAFGTHLDIVAPGSFIYSTNHNNSYVTLSGTSMAAPHISGVAALMLSVNPNLSAIDLSNIIEKTAEKVGPYSYDPSLTHLNGDWNEKMGYGLVDAHKAVVHALEYGHDYISGSSTLANCEAKIYQCAFEHPELFTYSWSASPNLNIIENLGASVRVMPAGLGIGTLSVNVYQQGRLMYTLTKNVQVTSVLSGITSISTTPFNISSNTTWSTETYLPVTATIDPNVTLTITGNLLCGEGGRILVQPGGKLVVDGGILTSACGGVMWQGIEVVGDRTKRQVEPYQGKVELMNGAIIENAYCGIYTGLHSDTVNYATTGGIISAENTTFKNNRQSVVINSYAYTAPSGSIANYNATFSRCTFTVDNNNIFAANNTGFAEHARLWDVKGVKFEGCTFSKFTNNLYGNGRGIYADDAGVYVGTYCPRPLYYTECECPESIAVYSSFSGFTTAVEVNTTGNPYSVRIDETSFNNNGTGVRINGNDYATVTRNTFNLDSWPSHSGGNVGLYLNTCTGYLVDDNVFERTTYPSGQLILDNSTGICVAGSGISPNSIHYNHFNNLTKGISVVGTNGHHKWSGLQMTCNDFSGGKHDIYLNNGATVSYVQGSSTKGADNMFSNVTYNTTNFHNPNAIPPISYYYSNSYSNLDPAHYSNLTKTSIKEEYDCSSTLCDNGIPGGGGGGGQYLAGFQSDVNAYTTSLANQSPADGTDGGVDETLSETVRALSETYYNAARCLLADTVLDLNELEQWHTVAQPIADPYSLTETRFMMGYDEPFVNTDADDAELANYADFHAMKLALRNSFNDNADNVDNINSPDINWYALTDAQIAQLQTIAERNAGRASVMAKGVLCFFFGICYDDELLVDDNADNNDNNGGAETRSAKAIQQNGETHLNVYPNPTDDILYVELSGAGIKSVGLYDLQGRVVETRLIASLQRTTALNVRSVPAGVYVLRVTDENGKEYHRKVVVR